MTGSTNFVQRPVDVVFKQLHDKPELRPELRRWLRTFGDSQTREHIANVLHLHLPTIPDVQGKKAAVNEIIDLVIRTHEDVATVEDPSWAPRRVKV